MGNHFNFLCCNTQSNYAPNLKAPTLKASVVVQDRLITLKKGDILGEQTMALVLQTDLTLQLDFNLGRKVKEATQFLEKVEHT